MFKAEARKLSQIRRGAVVLSVSVNLAEVSGRLSPNSNPNHTLVAASGKNIHLDGQSMAVQGISVYKEAPRSRCP